MGLKHSTSRSFTFAIAGLKKALKEEPNFRIHTVIGLLALVLALVLGFNYLEWIILVVTIAFVIIMELFNTVLENIVDMVSPDIREEAKTAKDISAAAVLISALTSLLVGIFLFLPKIISLTNIF